MDEFEQELRKAFARHPAPPGLKNQIMQRRRVLTPSLGNGLQLSFFSPQSLAVLLHGINETSSAKAKPLASRC
jgi:hypothetical protein